ncbi:MAG TPA: restriction endonuclease subunit S [Abditibacteriaceae bacterium]|nr:restriction endonuclease subunit S [Abditibacteriaceae bacterium]
MSQTWPLVPLDAVLGQRKAFIQIDDLQSYKRCRVQLHAKGIVLRDLVAGAEIKTKKQQVCRAGEFLVAEIDAKVGGFGIVPDDLDGAIVSSHYFLFQINEAKLERQFLSYFIRTPNFRDQVAAQGSTNYAAIRPKDVLGYQIPLPPIAEQRRIVARIEALAGKIEEARELRRLAVEEVEAVTKSAQRTLIGDGPTDRWVPLHSYVQEIVNGWSPPCEGRQAEGEEWGVLKLGAVSFGRFNPHENKALPPTLQPKPEFEIKVKDFLMSRANTAELVGACAIVNEAPARLMLCDKIFKFIFRNDKPIEHQYLDYVLKSPALRDQIVREATGTSPTMQNISKEKVRNLLIPPHDLPEQRRIVAYLDDLQAKVDALKQLQTQTAAELDALLPSILDQAFKGEL